MVLAETRAVSIFNSREEANGAVPCTCRCPLQLAGTTGWAWQRAVSLFTHGTEDQLALLRGRLVLSQGGLADWRALAAGGAACLWVGGEGLLGVCTGCTCTSATWHGRFCVCKLAGGAWQLACSYDGGSFGSVFRAARSLLWARESPTPTRVLLVPLSQAWHIWSSLRALLDTSCLPSQHHLAQVCKASFARCKAKLRRSTRCRDVGFRRFYSTGSW